MASTHAKGTIRPLARIMRTIGDQLVSSEDVAVVELVKNAYDADAQDVIVSFVANATGIVQVAVLDDGFGMTRRTLESAWMQPATDVKHKQHRSRRFGRRMLGEKGIGRFAAARLGDCVRVTSRTPGARTESYTEFDWREFDVPGRYLDEIQIPVNVAPLGQSPDGAFVIESWKRVSAKPKHGTAVVVTRLRSRWDDTALRRLRVILARLVGTEFRPANEFPFRISLDLPEGFSHLAGQVSMDGVLDEPHYSLSGTVDADGKYDFAFASSVPKKMRIELAGTFRDQNGGPPVCGPVGLDLRVWDRDAGSLRGLVVPGASTVKQKRDLLDELAGVSVYRDGFRLLPYGEPQNDWLRLDLRRVNNPTMRLSNNQISGWVRVSADENPGLVDQTNREGLMESDALESLRNVISWAMELLERKRYDLRHPPKPRTPKQKDAARGLFAAFELQPLVLRLRTDYPGDAALHALVDEKRKEIEASIAKVRETLSRYTRLATLGQLIDAVLHEARTPLGRLLNESYLAQSTLAKIPPECEETAKAVRGSINSMSRHAKSINAVFTRIEPFSGRKRGRPGEVVIEEVVQRGLELFHADLRTLGVATSVSDGRTVATVDAVEIEEIIMNLAQNSLYWLRQSATSNPRIDVSVYRDEAAVRIVFADNGPGVDPSISHSIFDPYFSTRPDGVGLGLAIAGEIAEDYYDGSLELLDSKQGAMFQVTLRRRV